jgi:hypothetical protein
MDDQQIEDLGKQLYAVGWRQGAIFKAPAVHFYRNHQGGEGQAEGIVVDPRAIKQKETLVVASQDCDITASEEQEPNIEALVCAVTKHQGYLDQIDRNSARYFVVDRAAGLVAFAKYRVHISKKALQHFTPIAWPSSNERFARFVRWLAWRYDRPAFPDELVQALQAPIGNALAALYDEHPDVGTTFTRVVKEVRANLPHEETPPFDIALVFLVHSAGLTVEEADAIHRSFEAMKTAVDQDVVHLDPELRVVDEEQMSVAEYRATRPLFLEYLTYQGEEIVGAEPIERV